MAILQRKNAAYCTNRAVKECLEDGVGSDAAKFIERIGLVAAQSSSTRQLGPNPDLDKKEIEKLMEMLATALAVDGTEG